MSAAGTKHGAGLGDEFGAEVDTAVTRIVEHALAYPRVRGETRRAVLTRFQYWQSRS